MITIIDRYSDVDVVRYGSKCDYFYSEKDKHLVSSNAVILATGITFEDAKSLVETMEERE